MVTFFGPLRPESLPSMISPTGPSRCFSSYYDENRISINDLTALIGKNDVGKSTILEALEIFFNQAKIESGDKNVFHAAEDTIIGCVFDDLPSEIALENVSTSFTAEYLLNEDGDLEIRKIYRTGGKQTIWINAKHPSNAGFDDLLSKKNQELKAIIRENGLENSVNLTINTEMRTALWESLGGSITYQKKLINWDQCDVPKVLIGLCMQNVTNAAEREKSIKSWLNGSLSKKITKEDLEDIDVWDEIELWFKKIRDIDNGTYVQKINS